MGVLNFSTDSLITGANVIDGNLYWTDDNSQPKKLEIDRFRDTTTFRDGVTVASNGDILSFTDVTVIRPHPYKVIDTNRSIAYTPTDEAPESPFEQIFPRFSYRWRYEDGQYSVYAPFTQAVFIPQERILTGTAGNPDATPPVEAILTSDVENYTEGYNTTLFNNVGVIRLDNIPRGTRDVVAVDILYTESISATIYILDTIEIPTSHRGLDYVINQGRYVERFTGSATEQPVPIDTDYDLLPLRYEVTARKIYRALPADQLSRQYDNVPRLAKAQEITANRLVYGNYLHQYDQPTTVSLSSSVIAAEAFPFQFPTVYPEYVGTTIDANAVAALVADSATDGLNVKGNRTYEVGVVYIDAYGRQGAMIPSGVIVAEDGSVTESSSFTTPFAQAQRQALVVKINSEAPEWADSYRYFVKDVSMDHHNLIAYNVYNDGAFTENMTPYVWLEFLSTDRNKIQDDTILIPRRINSAVSSRKTRHLVQEIQGEVPNAVRNLIAQGPNVDYIPLGPASRNSVGDSVQDFTYRLNANYTGSGLPDLEPTPRGDTIYLSEVGSEGIGRTGWYAAINSFLAQNRLEALEENEVGLTDGVRPQTQSVAIPFDAPQQLYAQFSNEEDIYVQVKSVSFAPVNVQNFDDGGESRDVLTVEFYEPIPSGIDASVTFRFHTARITEEAQERLQGRFWVRASRNGLSEGMSTFTEDEGEVEALHQVWFETEPAVEDSQLDLYWETSQSFCVCTEHGWPNKLNWSNCIAEVTTGGVYLETQRIRNQFNSVQLMKGVRVNTPADRFAEERRAYGMIYSGIYNSRTGVNRLNNFAVSDGITKELEPNYGSIQKLYTRDTNIIAFCEDKIFKILADKDMLFNGDGSGNVTASNRVLGQTTPFIGEYGISTQPESLAVYGHNLWCTDAKRGVVLQVTPNNGQTFEISSRGMTDYFRDRLRSVDNAIGMYDDYSDMYVISPQGYDFEGETESTLGYELSKEGFSSRFSYIPEAGLSLNNTFYTWSGGMLYGHNVSAQSHNNFYGTQYNSEIEVIFNDEPSVVKNFLALGYEGTEGWELMDMDTDIQEDAALLGPFVRRENKYFQAIVTNEPVYEFVAEGQPARDTGETQIMGGARGFFNKVRMRNTGTTFEELFAINTEVVQSSN